MPDESTRTVLVAIGADLGVALAKVCTAVFTGSTVVAATAAESLADTANDLFLLLARVAAAAVPTTLWPLTRSPGLGQQVLKAASGPTWPVPNSAAKSRQLGAGEGMPLRGRLAADRIEEGYQGCMNWWPD